MMAILENVSPRGLVRVAPVAAALLATAMLAACAREPPPPPAPVYVAPAPAPAPAPIVVPRARG